MATPGKLRKKIGPLDADKNKMNLGAIFVGSHHTTEIKIHNTTEETLYISYSGSSDLEGLEIIIDPAILHPAEYGKLVLVFNEKNQKYGKISKEILLDIEAEGQFWQGKIFFNANLVEDFSVLSAEEMANSPQISIKETMITIKSLKPGITRTETLEIGNTGFRDLYIHNIQTFNKQFYIEPT